MLLRTLLCLVHRQQVLVRKPELEVVQQPQLHQIFRPPSLLSGGMSAAPLPSSTTTMLAQSKALPSHNGPLRSLQALALARPLILSHGSRAEVQREQQRAR